MEPTDGKKRASGVPSRVARSRRWWVGVALWTILLILIDMTSRTIGLGSREAVYLVVAALASVGIVAIVAFARLANAPPELRTLKFLAVLLPSIFVLSIQVVLYFLEIDETVTEASEHVFATAILSAGAIPFSVYVFRSFTRLRDELARRAQHLESLHEVSMAVAAETAVPQLDQRIAEGARKVVAAERAVLLRSADGASGEVIVTAPQRTELSVGEIDRLHAVIAGEESIDGQDEALVLGVPIWREGAIVGAIGVMRANSPFTLEEDLLLKMFSVAASAASENVTRLEQAQLVAMIEERERIARDLHDDLGQLLGFLTTKTQAARELIAAGRFDRASDELTGLEGASRTLGAQVREAILGLRARIGPDRPLHSALEDYVTEFGIQARLSTELESTPDAGARLPGTVQYQLLRIAQEALSNTRRHAGASRVRVRLVESDGQLELGVVDDGVGFDTTEAKAGGGFGLRTMEERVRSLHGTFGVSSASGAGTQVAVRIPLERV